MPSLYARRVIAFVACGLFFGVAVFLLIADRSSALVGTAQRIVIDGGQQIEGRYNIDVLDRQDIPGTSDQIGHAALWGAGMFLTGWLGRRTLPIAFTALLLAATSVAFEVSQPLLSSTRAFQPSDLVGNVAGIGGAAILLIVVLRILRIGNNRAFSRPA